MAVPSSGQLRLRADINQEINGNDSDSNVALGTLSNDAGFDEPDTMSEFYGYSSETAPDVNNASNTNVQSTSMRITATLTDNGGTTLSLNPYASNYVKFYFGTNSNVTSNTVYGASLLSGTSGESGSTYYIDRTGLTQQTTYYYGFYAQNGSGNDITTGSRTTPLPTNPSSNARVSCGGDCGNGNAANAYSQNITVTFGGTGNYTHGGPYNPPSQVKVYGPVWGNRSDWTSNFNSSWNGYSVSGSGTYGPCYCGSTYAQWLMTRSGYGSKSGNWCNMCVSNPAWICAEQC
jgi:hypothetical protein